MNIVKDYACSGGGIVAIMHDLNLTSMFADKVCHSSSRQKGFCQGVPKGRNDRTIGSRKRMTATYA